jgi:hypothetical protein
MFDTTSIHHLPRLHKLLRLLKKRVYNLGYNRHRAKRGSRKDLNFSKKKKKKNWPEHASRKLRDRSKLKQKLAKT